MTTRRLVIDVPHATCVGCGARQEAAINYVEGGGSGHAGPSGAMMVRLNPPAGWAKLDAHRAPEDSDGNERGARLSFMICGACYGKGVQYGLRAEATFEAVPA